MKAKITSVALLLSAALGAQGQYFTKITEGPVATHEGDSRSVNWVDVNNDGLLDLFISNGPSGGQSNRLYLNSGDGNFTAVTTGDIVSDGEPSDGATFADIDNDGDLDAFVVNWYNANNMLFVNDGSGSFTRVTDGQIVNDHGYSETASFGDYNNDGLVDLYVTNSSGNKRNFLYKNNGANGFQKITTGGMVTDNGVSRNINWTDINNDGMLDIFVTNEELEHENLYLNDGNEVFTAVTTGDLVNAGENTMSSSWADYDNDGDMDVLLTNFNGFNQLYRNDGDMNFTLITTDTIGLSLAYSFSGAWSDIDNDGDLDLFVTNAFLQGALLNNFLYINNGDGTFSRNNTDPVTLAQSWSYGAAFGDCDNDGFQDLAVATCRFDGADPANLIYHNNGNENNWLMLKLTGTYSNKAAIGARVKIKATINAAEVWQMREVSAQSSYCGQNDLRPHFGLGDATSVDSMIIIWPRGGVQTFGQVETNQILEVEEPEEMGIGTAYEWQDVRIFPNPTAQYLNISFPTPLTTGAQLKLTDVNGRTVFTKEVGGNNSIHLDLKKLNISRGTYFLDLKQAKSTLHRKIFFQ